MAATCAPGAGSEKLAGKRRRPSAAGLGASLPGIGVTELLIILAFVIVPIVLADWLAAKKGYEPVWLWVLLALFFSWITIIALAALPSRRPA